MIHSAIEQQYDWKIELKERFQILEAERQTTALSESQRVKNLHLMRWQKCGQQLPAENDGAVEIAFARAVAA